MAELDHLRTQVLDAIKAKLLAQCEVFGGDRGWLAPRPPIEPRECPAFTVMQAEEDVTYYGGAIRFQVRSFSVHVTVLTVLEPNALVDGKVVRDLNNLAAAVERVMVPESIDGQGLGLGETDVVLVKTETPQVSEQGSKPMGEMALTYRIVFSTQEGEPTVTTNNAD